jgi:SAM-dependent methyltransferase
VDRLLEATAAVERRHFWFRGLRRFVRPLVAAAVAGRNRPRLLDAGCGTGANLALLSDHATCYALDLSRTGLAHARAAGHRRLVRATVMAIPFPADAFDVVTSFDVLYALRPECARRALAEMARVLKPGGWLIVNVAALQILRGGHSVLAEEVRRYDRRTLAADIEGAGLQVTRITYTNAVLFPFVLAARLAQRAAGLDTPEHTGREIQVPPSPVNAAFDALLALEALALRAVNMPVGSSLLCTARKGAGAAGGPGESTGGASGAPRSGSRCGSPRGRG